MKPREPSAMASDTAGAAVVAAAAALALAATLEARDARAQAAPSLTARGSEADAAARRSLSTGDVALGVFRAPARGATAVRFLLRNHGSEPILVTDETDPYVATYHPACVTPCTLYFTPGRRLVELGRSPVRARPLLLTVDSRPLEVQFARDSLPGVVAGTAVAGLGLVAMIIGIPLAVLEPRHTLLAWSLAGGGAALFLGGGATTLLSLGGVDVRSH